MLKKLLQLILQKKINREIAFLDENGRSLIAMMISSIVKHELSGNNGHEPTQFILEMRKRDDKSCPLLDELEICDILSSEFDNHLIVIADDEILAIMEVLKFMKLPAEVVLVTADRILLRRAREAMHDAFNRKIILADQRRLNLYQRNCSNISRPNHVS